MFYVLLFFNLLNAFVIFDFMDKMYGRKYSRRRVYFFAYVVFVILHVIVNMQRIISLNFVYEIVCISIFSYFLYNESPKKYLYNFIFALYLIFMDQGGLSALSIMMSQTLFHSNEKALNVMAIGVIDFSIVFLTYRFLIRIFKRRFIDAATIRQNIFFVILATLEILILVYFSQPEQSNIKDFETVLIFFILSFLCLDFYIIYLFKFVAKHNALQNQVNLSAQQSAMLDRNLHDAEEKYMQMCKVAHEVRNYLQILRTFYQQGDKIAAERYAEQICEKLNELEYRYQCDNRILHILINDKLFTTKEKDIEVRLDMENIEWSFMETLDLTTLFANLLNNAAEACERVTDGARFMEVRVRALNDHAVIRISNSYSEENLRKKGEVFLSTKRKHSGKGIGIDNLNAVVQKYGGNIQFEAHDSIFTVKVILPISVA